MTTHYIKAGKKSEPYNPQIDNFIERIKKMRALNCSPSDVGIDNFLLKRLISNKVSAVTKIL